MACNLGTDPTRICRICIQDITNQVSESMYEFLNSGRPSLNSMLSTICPTVFSRREDLKNGNTMPERICSSCVLKIEAAYELHQTCIESDRKLCERFLVKQEEVQIEDAIVHIPTEFYEEPISIKAENSNHDERMEAEAAGKISVEQGNASKILVEKLADHKPLLGTGKSYTCRTCGEQFINWNTLKAHRVTHKGEKSFICPTCDKGFPYKSRLDKHMLVHSEKMFACNQCPSKFFTKGNLKSHQMTHSKERNFCCDICSKRFKMKNGLIAHVARAHSGDCPTYTCDVCNKTFSSAGHVNRHKLIHTGEKPYKCTECDRSFTQGKDLVNHSKTHFGDNPYQCDRCDESFRLISHLRDHYVVHANSDPSYNDGEERSNGSSGNKKSKDRWFTISKVLRRRSQRKPTGSGDNSNDQGSDEELQAVQLKFCGKSETLSVN